MAISTRETCRQYFERRLREGWKCVSRDGPFVVLLSPDGIRKEMDLRNDVETLRPNGAGDLTQWVVQFPDSGAHWDKVDEVVADDDTTYVAIPGENAVDLYALPAHSGSGTINSVTVYARAYVAAGGGFSIRIQTHSTGYNSSNLTGAAWTTHSYEWATNPNTSAAWTWDEIDALQAGMIPKRFSEESIKVTQVYVEVDYTGDAVPPTLSMGVEAR